MESLKQTYNFETVNEKKGKIFLFVTYQIFACLFDRLVSDLSLVLMNRVRSDRLKGGSLDPGSLDGIIDGKRQKSVNVDQRLNKIQGNFRRKADIAFFFQILLEFCFRNVTSD